MENQGPADTSGWMESLARGCLVGHTHPSQKQPQVQARGAISTTLR